MKKLLFVVIASLGLAASAFSQYSSSSLQNAAFKTSLDQNQPVLIELFTSASCFACPPAEMALAKIEKEQPFENAKVVTLEFHVDYRDGFGMTDALASPLFTQRQKVYDRKFRTGKIYTPQMVVDGDIEFSGSDLKKAKKAVNKSLKNEKGLVELSLAENGLTIEISDLPKHDYLTIYMAIVEDGILTRKRKNEDEANVSVVRSLNGVGRILPSQNSFEMVGNIQIASEWVKENLSVVVFAQENSTRKILGVSKIKLEITSEDRKL